MKTHAKNPLEKAQPPHKILNTSIKAMLTPERPVFSSALRRTGRIGIFSIICAAAAVWHAAPAQAQVPTPLTWDGAGSGPNFSNNSNWSPVGTPSPGTPLHFAGNNNLAPVNDIATLVNGQSVASITFDAGASSFTITGNTLGLTSGITNNSSALQTLNLPLQLNGSQTWNAASGELVVGSTVNLQGYNLTVNGSHAITFNGPITDSATGSSAGQFIKNGGGLVFLQAANTYTGATIVNGGTLIINGSTASTQTSIAKAGAIAGSGFIGGNLTSDGIVAPGRADPTNLQLFTALSNVNTASISAPTNFQPQDLVLTVKGNYKQNSGATLIIAYGGPLASQHNQLAVNGQASLDGTLRIVQVNGARLKVGDVVPIVTATGGVTGTFATVTNAPLINAKVVYEPNAVVLEPTQGSIGDTLRGVHGVTSNALAVAKALDSAALDPRAGKLFASLNTVTTPNELFTAVQHVNPEQLSATGSVSNATSNVHAQNLQLRMEALRAGVSGFSSMGYHTADVSGDSNVGYAGPSGSDGKSGKEVAPPPPDNRWGTFITGAGEFNHVGDTQQARGFNLDSGGITLGVDYRFTDHFVAGIFTGYTYTGIDIADGGRIAVDTGKVGLYSTYFDGGFYVDTAVQGGYDSYDTHRSGFGGTAHSSPHGGDLNVLFAPGYNWTFGALTIGPTASFQYAYQSTNGFTETGSLAPLTVQSEHSESIVSSVGMKASYDWKIDNITIRPELRLGWEHEYSDVAIPVGARLASGAGDPFTVVGPEIGRDSLHVGAGFAVVWSDRLSTYIYYDGEFFRQNYDSSSVTGGFRYSF